MVSFPILLLTTFISVGGQIQAVPKDSPQAFAYEQTETDIGKYSFGNKFLKDVSDGDALSFDLQPVISFGGRIQTFSKNSAKPLAIQNDNNIGMVSKNIVMDSFKYNGSTIVDIDTSGVASDPVAADILDNNEDYLFADVSSGDVSGGDISVNVIQDNSEIAELLNEQIDLLSENSSTVTGTLNSTVLDLMDRMIDDVPSYYKYAGFRINSDDAYQSILYISKKATLNNNVITFGDDCIAVRFYRQQYSNYNYYVTYDRYESSNATVQINDDTIVYTNVSDGFPSLGNHQRFEIEYFWIGILVLIGSVLFLRRNNNA